VSAAPHAPLCAPCGAGVWGTYLAVLHGWGRYPRVKEARRVQYPPDVARKMCNIGPITPVDDRLVARGQYCMPTDDRLVARGQYCMLTEAR